ncbi:hypothetical protein [Andreprevotia lacus]|uniref:hypothetical protein n=1 Tax=Andreprevotia lacus TaxID=1121000 RepID=UPI00111BEE84|nr:hypothetical protein [Andreprevotia lacus]
MEGLQFGGIDCCRGFSGFSMAAFCRVGAERRCGRFDGGVLMNQAAWLCCFLLFFCGISFAAGGWVQTVDGFEFEIAPPENGWSVVTARGGPCVKYGLYGMKFRVDEIYSYRQGDYKNSFSISLSSTNGRSLSITPRIDWSEAEASAFFSGNKDLQGAYQCARRFHMQYAMAAESWMSKNEKLIIMLNPRLKRDTVAVSGSTAQAKVAII